ncbi:MAG: carboxypeptidase regulatory-like domain-containing protein [Bacteroidales bacterium]|nr:carboxypeptidase regulatory-like domain-containing protein [Bacteroidales bacterium]
MEKFNHKLIFVLFLTCLVSFFVRGQLVVYPNQNPKDLIKTLLGDGVKVDNIKYTGSDTSNGVFYGTNSNIGFNKGIILSTGRAIYAVGPNDDKGQNCSKFTWDSINKKNICKTSYSTMKMEGDSDLEAILGCIKCTKDASVLEFDFVPMTSPIEFKYVFASEEYPEYVCSQFNDIFAFLLSGPKPLGGQYINHNLAIIPDTTLPVTINSINIGEPGKYTDTQIQYPAENCMSLDYSNFYIDNGNGSTPDINSTVQYDGIIKVLKATAEVIPYETYHIKLALTDVADNLYDSGVFLEANKFKCLDVNIFSDSGNPLIDSVAYEGFNTFKYIISISKPLIKEFNIKLSYSGSGIQRPEFANLPTNIIIPPGDTLVELRISPVIDNIINKTDTLIINFHTSEYVTHQKTLLIKDSPVLSISGKVTYNNVVSTSLSGVKVYLLNKEEKIIDTAYTDERGIYYFNKKLMPGNYSIQPVNSKKGSTKIINPLDALIINRFYLGIYSIKDPLKLIAADLDRQVGINPIDALLVLRYYLGLIKSFPAGEWYFEKKSVKLINESVICNIKGILYGDVNASYR